MTKKNINNTKVKVVFCEMRKRLIFVGKWYKPQIIKVTPYIDETQIDTINIMCLEQFFNFENKDDTTDVDLDRYEVFPNIRMVFDMIILNECTNISIADETYSIFIKSKIMDKVRKKIYNYDDTWQMVKDSIALKNSFIALKLVSDTLPSQTKMEENLSTIKTVFNEAKKNPKLMKEIMDNSIKKTAIEETRTLFDTELEKKKVEKAKSKSEQIEDASKKIKEQIKEMKNANKSNE